VLSLLALDIFPFISQRSSIEKLNSPMNFFDMPEYILFRDFELYLEKEGMREMY